MKQILDYKELSGLLITQYKDSSNMRALIEKALHSANDIEQALFEIRDKFYLSTAQGVQLDIIGLVFNLAREGRPDFLYREAIREKATLAYSGEPERIIELVQSIYGATFVEYTPARPGKYYLYTDARITSRQLNPINPAGVLALIKIPIIDAGGNYLVDAVGRLICSVRTLNRIFLVDGKNRFITDAQGRVLVTLN